jgi:hypothetical protein
LSAHSDLEGLSEKLDGGAEEELSPVGSICGEIFDEIATDIVSPFKNRDFT